MDYQLFEEYKKCEDEHILRLSTIKSLNDLDSDFIDNRKKYIEKLTIYDLVINNSYTLFYIDVIEDYEFYVKSSSLKPVLGTETFYFFDEYYDIDSFKYVCKGIISILPELKKNKIGIMF